MSPSQLADLLHDNTRAWADRWSAVGLLQVQAWNRDLHRSQLHMRNLTASRATDTSGDSSSAGDADAGSGAESSPASQAKPMIEIRAGLGELALIISGRVCEEWWPPQARSPPCRLALVSVLLCLEKSHTAVHYIERSRL